VVMITSTTENS